VPPLFRPRVWHGPFGGLRRFPHGQERAQGCRKTTCATWARAHENEAQWCIFPQGDAPSRRRRNALVRPVLKHGPRSVTCVRVFGLETRGRNKRERGGNPQGGTIDQSRASAKDLSLSTYAATRKMVNYSRVGRSQRKLWWRFEAVLTCKSIVKLGYRGERLIEPSSSWFPPKFPLG